MASETLYTYRQISRDEIDLLCQIDRTETIERIFYQDGDQLVLQDERWDVPEWTPSDKANRIAALRADYDRGATAFGAFAGERLVGMAIVDHNFLPSGSCRLNLIGLWVSDGHRARGVGKTLMRLAVQCARERGAKALYVSATPSENTVRFYMSLGCRPTKIIDPELFALEPEDIHMELSLVDQEASRMKDKYRTTFTAENGDTWEFEYDYAAGTGVVRGSDIDDDEEYKVIEGVAYNLVMDQAEQRWLLGAWEEATGRESAFHDDISQ